MTRLHVILVTLGSAGDVHPFVAIGRALLARGHDVTLIPSAHYEDTASEEAFAFAGLGTREDYSRVINEPDLWHPQRGFQVFARRVVIPAIRPVYQAVSNNLGPNTIVVAQGQAFGAHLAHELHQLPFVTVNLQPVAFRTAFDSPLFPPWLPIAVRPFVNRLIDLLLLDRELAEPLNSFRAELGLSPVNRILGSWAHSPLRTIGLFPEWFSPPQPDWPANTTLSGFVLLAQGSSTTNPGLDEFLDAGAPPIVFTPGTEMKLARAFFDRSARALVGIRRRGIFLTRHTDHLPSPLPEGIIWLPYVPFASILPRAAALVHHGGIGTIAQAFAAGIPQLIRPMAHDQPDNAARVQRLGVGVTIDPSRYTADRVHSSLQALLTSKSARQACQLYSAKVNSDEALAVVCQGRGSRGPHGQPRTFPECPGSWLRRSATRQSQPDPGLPPPSGGELPPIITRSRSRRPVARSQPWWTPLSRSMDRTFVGRIDLPWHAMCPCGRRLGERERVLKISNAGTTVPEVTLRLDGQVTGRWVEILRRSCDVALHRGARLTLDLGHVSFADADGIALLRGLTHRQVRLVNASPFMAQQIRGGP